MCSLQNTCSVKQLVKDPGMTHLQGHQAGTLSLQVPSQQGTWSWVSRLSALSKEGVGLLEDGICQSKPTEEKNLPDQALLGTELSVGQITALWSKGKLSLSAWNPQSEVSPPLTLLTVLTALSKISIFQSWSVVLGFAILMLQSRHCKCQGPALLQKSCPSPLQNRRLPRGKGKWLKPPLTAWTLRTLIILFKTSCLGFFLH